ncbi:hypothetical protein ACHAXT_007249 [Thalassiosira profunda]
MPEDVKYVVVDVETHDWKTGEQPSRNAMIGRVVEIAWVAYNEAGEEVEAKQYLLKPHGGYERIAEKAVKYHGITNRLVRDRGSDAALVFNEFSSLLQKIPPTEGFVIAHNMKHEDAVLYNNLDEEGRKIWDAVPKCDTMEKAPLALLPRKHFNKGGGDNLVETADDEVDGISDAIVEGINGDGTADEDASQAAGHSPKPSDEDRQAALEIMRQYQAQTQKYALKRGTRTTGAGASWRNPSIFSVDYSNAEQAASYSPGWTAAALAGDMLNRGRQSKSHKSKKDHGGAGDTNPMLWRLWAGRSDRGTLVLQFPGRGATDVELTESSDASNDGRSVQARFVTDTTAQSALQLVPIEGIYGVYDLPCSGPHAVLITESEGVYSSPLPAVDEEDGAEDQTSPLLQLRRIRSLEIVALRDKTLGSDDGKEESSEEQLAEEARQLRLLRRSFKEHDFYFTVPSDVVHDVTHSLQRSFIEHSAESNTPEQRMQNHRWWVPYADENDGASDQRSRRRKRRREVDSRFFWNEQPALALLPPPSESVAQSPHALLLDHVIPVTSAFVGMQRDVPIPSTTTASSIREKYDQVLISRRSKYRTGTRFTRRGADGTGAVANYAETEQICFVRSDENDDTDGGGDLLEVYSHVQTRGSIPLHWSSPAYVTEYRPRVYVGVDPVAQARGLRDHLLGELWRYSSPASGRADGPKQRSRIRAIKDGDAAVETKLAMVNLIDKHGDQGRLGTAFDSVLSAVLEVYQPETNQKEKGAAVEPFLRPGSVEHIWYDFHAECSGGRWDRLSQLLEQVSPALDRQGYFCAVPTGDGSNWELRRLQDGVVRTNCMDCLDRTNVVQSMFGRYALYRQLHERPGLSKRRRALPLECVVAHKQQPLTLPWTEGEAAHRFLWADNADAISRLYAGTPALKGDFTRTGKRTRRGALDDGVNSLQRYYLNNFIDADRQEGMDLLVGSADFNLVPTEEDDDSSRVFMLQELEKSSRRRGYEQTHARIKVEPGQSLFSEDGGSVDDEITPKLSLRWLPEDLRRHMKSEAFRSRAPLSSAAEEEDVDAPTSSDFLLQVTSSAAGDDDLLEEGTLQVLHRRSSLAQPWWVGDEGDDECDPDDDDGQLAQVLETGDSLQLRARHALGFARKRAVAASLILLTKAPILSAAVVVAVLAGGISPLLDNGDSWADSD